MFLNAIWSSETPASATEILASATEILASASEILASAKLNGFASAALNRFSASVCPPSDFLFEQVLFEISSISDFVEEGNSSISGFLVTVDFLLSCDNFSRRLSDLVFLVEVWAKFFAPDFNISDQTAPYVAMAMRMSRAISWTCSFGCWSAISSSSGSNSFRAVRSSAVILKQERQKIISVRKDRNS